MNSHPTIFGNTDHPIYKTGTRVQILAFVGSHCEHDWSETGTVIRRSHPETLPRAWHRVRFDQDGAVMTIHSSRLRPAT